MSKKNAQRNKDRRARVAELRAEQLRKERRRTFAFVGVATAIALVLVGVAGVAVYQDRQQEQDLEEAATQPIEGVQTFDNLSRNHVQTAVDYAQTPPAGGDHNPVWANCGVYAEPIEPTTGVHSLEHGAVWITYRPDLPQAQVDRLSNLADGLGYAVLSPYPGLPEPVVASAWGVQLKLDSAEDPRLATFLTKYMQGSQTPEPGAACTGGVGSP